jgi:conjugal transfer pilus assembly protein TraV
MRLSLSCAVLPLLIAMGGCTSLTGLDAKDNFKCQAPDGISCMSISGVSANIDRNNIPQYIKDKDKEELSRDMSGAGKGDAKPKNEVETKEKVAINYASDLNSTNGISPATMQTLSSGTTLRAPPKELRIWMAPTEDADGDLNEQRYIYVVVNDGKWIIDAVRINSRDKYTRMNALIQNPVQAESTTQIQTTPKAQPGQQNAVPNPTR